MTKLFLLGIIAVVVAAGAWLTPSPATSTIAFDQIRTDKATAFPYVASAGRCNFVEMVN